MVNLDVSHLCRYRSISTKANSNKLQLDPVKTSVVSKFNGESRRLSFSPGNYCCQNVRGIPRGGGNLGLIRRAIKLHRELLLPNFDKPERSSYYSDTNKGGYKEVMHDLYYINIIINHHLV